MQLLWKWIYLMFNTFMLQLQLCADSDKSSVNLWVCYFYIICFTFLHLTFAAGSYLQKALSVFPRSSLNPLKLTYFHWSTECHYHSYWFFSLSFVIWSNSVRYAFITDFTSGSFSSSTLLSSVSWNSPSFAGFAIDFYCIWGPDISKCRTKTLIGWL